MFRRSPSAGAGSRSDLFLDRHGLAGQRRLVDAELRGLEEPQVGRDDRARFQEDEIPRHQLGRGEHPGLPVPDHGGAGGGHRGERLHGALGAVLLDEADRRVQDHDRHDRDRVGGVADRGRDDGRAQEDEDHEVGELVEEHPEAGPSLRLGQPVRAMLGQPPRRLRRREPGHLGGSERPEDVRGAGQVPVHHGRASRGAASPAARA
jgi:hypothetical protein